MSLVPLFASAVAASTIWSAETEISCPIAMVGFERSDHLSLGLKIPVVSPGSSMPVFAPKPKSRSFFSKSAGDAFSAIWAEPSLQDSLITSRGVTQP